MTMPAVRYLKPVIGTRIPTSLVFIDTEAEVDKLPGSRSEDQTLQLGVAIHVRRERGRWTRRAVLHFDIAEQLWSWVLDRQSRRKPIWLFSHNLGYDLTLCSFMELLDNGTFTTRPWPDDEDEKPADDGVKRRPWHGGMVMTDPPTIFNVRSVAGTLRCVDTMNYVRMSLKDIGDSIGHPKMRDPGPAADLAERRAYCLRDVEILERMICGMLDEWEKMDCGGWQTTSAGLAWSAWRRCCPPKSVLIDQSEAHTKIARDGYYGARAEPYYIGPIYPPYGKGNPAWEQNGKAPADAPRGPVYLLDVRSLYPHVMREWPFPVKFLETEYRPTHADLRRRMQYHLPIAQVLLETDDATYPLREETELIFPRGSYLTTLPGPELDRALNAGHVIAIGWVAWYLPGRPFVEFVDKWNGLRERYEDAGNKCGGLMAKMVMNALSGKFAQHGMAWHDDPLHFPLTRFGEWLETDAQTKQWKRWRSIAGHCQWFERKGEARDAFPAMSAFITSYGREHMLGITSRCPARSVLYQDTDGILVTADGYRAIEKAGLISFRELGRLKLEGMWDTAQIAGIKHWWTEDTRRISGVKKDAVPGEDGGWIQSRFQRLPDLLRGYKGPRVRVDTFTFKVHEGAKPREPGPGGWTLPPVRETPAVIPF